MNREKEITRVTLVGSVVNVALTAFKFVAGILGRSAAMTSDAIHSLSDLLTDAVVIIFVKISGKPADKKYEYGHGKFETLATAFIGVALLIVAGGILYQAGVALVSFIRGAVIPKPGMIALWAALVSIILKEGAKAGASSLPPLRLTPGTTAAMPSRRSEPYSASAERSFLATSGPFSTLWPLPWSVYL